MDFWYCEALYILVKFPHASWYSSVVNIQYLHRLGTVAPILRWHKLRTIAPTPCLNRLGTVTPIPCLKRLGMFEKAWYNSWQQFVHYVDAVAVKHLITWLFNSIGCYKAESHRNAVDSDSSPRPSPFTALWHVVCVVIRPVDALVRWAKGAPGVPLLGGTPGVPLLGGTPGVPGI